MRKCAFSIVLIMLLGAGGGLAVLTSGAISFRASQTPPAMETKLATMALNASVSRHAPQQANPYPPTEENLLRGMKLYQAGCSECHGVPGQKNPYGDFFILPFPSLLVMALGAVRRRFTTSSSMVSVIPEWPRGATRSTKNRYGKFRLFSIGWRAFRHPLLGSGASRRSRTV